MLSVTYVLQVPVVTSLTAMDRIPPRSVMFTKTTPCAPRLVSRSIQLSTFCTWDSKMSY